VNSGSQDFAAAKQANSQSGAAPRSHRFGVKIGFGKKGKSKSQQNKGTKPDHKRASLTPFYFAFKKRAILRTVRSSINAPSRSTCWSSSRAMDIAKNLMSGCVGKADNCQLFALIRSA
jgi:hypothetical protein